MKTKILMYILTASLTGSMGLLGKVGCDRSRLQTANEKLNEELMEADLELGRALTKFGNAEDYIDKLEVDIKDEIKDREAVVNSYGELQVKYKILKKKKRGKRTKVVYKKKIIKVPMELELKPGMYYEALAANQLAPLDVVHGEYQDARIYLFSRLYANPTTQGGARWEYDYRLNMNYKVQFTETHLPSGGINHYATVWEVDNKGKKIKKLEIKDFSVVVARPDKSRWYWWAPHIDVGFTGGAMLTPPREVFGGSIGFSPFGYGKTVNDLDWRFLRVSVDLAGTRPGFGITGAVYNIGRFIPFLSDLWLGPHVGLRLPTGDPYIVLLISSML